MKFMKMITVAVASVAMLLSCTKETPAVESLDVNPNNLSGYWKQVEWRGAPLHESTYFYMSIVRKDKTFTFYQNFDSIEDMAHVITGRYNIETDPEIGAIIIGEYDYSSGFWSHKYAVKDLTTESMTWVATDDPSEIRKFIRVSEIPDSVKVIE